MKNLDDVLIVVITVALVFFLIYMSESLRIAATSDENERACEKIGGLYIENNRHNHFCLDPKAVITPSKDTSK